jgi:DNA-directed RNA polymerase specialized sigma24 family protein
MSEHGTPPVPPHDPRAVEQRELLRAQPWGKIVAQLTAIAHKRLGGSKKRMTDAKDLAQEAIADAYRSLSNGGWDPSKGPLLGFLVSHVIGAAFNIRRRKRNTCEVWLDEEWEEEERVCKHEKHLGEDKPAPDEAFDRLRFASTFHDRLVARFVGEPFELELIALMKDGVATPVDLAAATSRDVEDVKSARRRIRYHADEITKELSASAVPAHASAASGTGSKEAMQ